MKPSKKNNYGRGWYFQFSDGHYGWILGMSAQEKRIAEREHGKLIKWAAA